MGEYVLDIRHLGSTCKNIYNHQATEIRLHVDAKPV